MEPCPETKRNLNAEFENLSDDQQLTRLESVWFCNSIYSIYAKRTTS